MKYLLSIIIFFACSSCKKEYSGTNCSVTIGDIKVNNVGWRSTVTWRILSGSPYSFDIRLDNKPVQETQDTFFIKELLPGTYTGYIQPRCVDEKGNFSMSKKYYFTIRL